jgi:hypothetical protein
VAVKSISRSLFKKLSALRATLTDEEQILLDSLVVGHYQFAAHRSIAGFKAIRLPNQEQNEAGMPSLPNEQSAASRPLRITFDQELEFYLIE